MAGTTDLLKHVLLLEDDHDIRVLLRMALEEKGFYVTMTARASDARTMLERVKIDFMVANVMLPDGTCFPAVDFARQKEVPVLLMTGSVEQMARLQAEGEYYLAKPFHLSELIRQISAALLEDVARTA